MAPKPPNARRGPAEPGRASIIVAGNGGPDMGAPEMAGCLRRGRGAARLCRAATSVGGLGAISGPPVMVLLAHVERLDRLHVGGVSSMVAQDRQVADSVGIAQRGQ